jgi:hypothetical protein
MQDHKRRYDIAVAYRIYPKVAAVAASLRCGHDKYLLSEICLKSFKDSLSGLRAKIWVLLDGCPPEYADLFTKYFDPDDVTLLPFDSIGNQATFGRQIDILLEQQDSNVVYFAEDDYVYLPGQFHHMIDFLSEHEDVHFITPYDHLDCYTLDLHRQPKWLTVHGGRHWRTAASTCLTFLTTRQTLKKTEAVFRSYERRNFDSSLWLSLTKRRIFNLFFFGRHVVRDRFISKVIMKSWIYCWRQILFGPRWRLWVPLPAVGTHLSAQSLSPNVDWPAIMEQAERHILGSVSTGHPFQGTRAKSMVREV